MTDPRTFAYISQGLRLNVCEWGDVSSPPLVLLHGVRDHARSWDFIAAALADRFRVLAPDLRGHGDSAHAGGGFYPSEAYVFDLAELVLSQSLAPVILVGHSLGGNVALRYAGTFPETVARVVAIEGLSHSPKLIAEQRAIPVETRLREWIKRQREIAAKPPRRYTSLAEAIARVAAQHPRFDPDFAAHVARYGVRDNGDGTVSFKFDPGLRAFPPFEAPAEDVWRLWSRVNCPAWLVYGAQSWASNPVADGRVRHFAQATVTTLENAGHWPHHDRRDAFLAALLAFLG